MAMTMSRSTWQKTMLAGVGGFASLATLAGLGSSAWACTGSPASTSISPKVGLVGGQVTVAGTGYGQAPVEIRWSGTTGPLLATAQGPNFSVKVDVPADAAPGMFYIAAVQRDGAGAVSNKVADTFEVTGPAASTAPSPAGPSAASATGDLWSGFAQGPGPVPSTDVTTPADPSTSPNLAIGVGLMGVGSAAVFGGFAVAAVRRRRVTTNR